MFLELNLSMNINPSGQEKNSDQTSDRSENFAINLGHVLSYRCTFCERGFSNAQALGGHMNIHRKDRAKLREFRDENLLSLDITKNTDICKDSSPANSCTSEETRKAASDANVDDLDEVVPASKENSIRPFPLFAEAPSTSGGDGGAAGSGRCDKRLEKSKIEMIHGEVDLELRLGHEPRGAKNH